MRDMQRKEAIDFLGSIMFPPGGHAKRIFDFTESNESSVLTLLIICNWEQHADIE